MSESRANELEKWLKQAYPKSVRISSKNRGRGNHAHDNAIDVVGIEKLPKKDQENILNTAMKLGLRVGNELQGKPGVDGYTGSHYHFDATYADDDREAWRNSHFIRGAKSGKAYRAARTKAENKQNDIFNKQMRELGNKPLVYGPTDEEVKYLATPSQPPIKPVESDKIGVADRGLSLQEKLALYGQMNPEADNIKEQRQAVDKEISGEGQIDTTRLIAMQEMNGPLGGGGGRIKSQKEEEVEAAKKDILKKGVGDEMVKRTPEKVAKVVESLPIDEQTQAEVKQDIALKATGQDQARDPISSQFTEALTYFLPTIIGGLGGLAFGGEQAAIAGAEAGHQLGEGFNKFQMDRQRLQQQQALQRNRGLDVNSFVDKDGKPVQLDQMSGIFTDMSGKRIDPSKVQRTNIYKQNRSLQQKEKQMSDVQKRFDLKQGQLSDKQTEDLEGLIKTQDTLKRISLQASGVNTGPIATFLQAGAEKIDMAPEEFTRLKQEVSTMNNEYIKLITGAQMSEPEAERIMQAMPSIYDDDKTFKLKVKVLQEIMQSQEKAFAEAIASGQGLKAEANQAIKNILDKYESSTVPSGKYIPTDEEIENATAEQLDAWGL